MFHELHLRTSDNISNGTKICVFCLKLTEQSRNTIYVEFMENNPTRSTGGGGGGTAWP